MFTKLQRVVIVVGMQAALISSAVATSLTSTREVVSESDQAEVMRLSLVEAFRIFGYLQRPESGVGPEQREESSCEAQVQRVVLLSSRNVKPEYLPKIPSVRITLVSAAEITKSSVTGDSFIEVDRVEIERDLVRVSISEKLIKNRVSRVGVILEVRKVDDEWRVTWVGGYGSDP